MKTSLLAFALSFLVGIGTDDAETKLHQGTWQATSFIYDGTESSEEVVASITRTVEDDHVVWKREGKSFAGTVVTLDPSKDPKEIDIVPDGGPKRDKRVLGIYKLDKDELTLCTGAPGGERPDSFEALKGSGRSLMKFKRIDER